MSNQTTQKILIIAGEHAIAKFNNILTDIPVIDWSVGNQNFRKLNDCPKYVEMFGDSMNMCFKPGDITTGQADSLGDEFNGMHYMKLDLEGKYSFANIKAFLDGLGIRAEHIAYELFDESEPYAVTQYGYSASRRYEERITLADDIDEPFVKNKASDQVAYSMNLLAKV